VLIGLDFGLVTMAVGVVTDNGGTALIGSLASTISGIRRAGYVSLFYSSVGNNQISRGQRARFRRAARWSA